MFERGVGVLIVLERAKFDFMKSDLSFEQVLKGYTVDLDKLALKVLKRSDRSIWGVFKGFFEKETGVSCKGFLEVEKTEGVVRIVDFWIDCEGAESELELGAVYREFDLLLRSYHWDKLRHREV